LLEQVKNDGAGFYSVTLFGEGFARKYSREALITKLEHDIIKVKSGGTTSKRFTP